MSSPPRSTGTSKKQRLLQRLSQRSPAAIGEAEWTELLRDLAPISESYLRRLLHETGIPVEQPWAGIRQHNFAELEDSLVAMEQVYGEAVARGDRERARYCRKLVIQSKDHARLAARSAKATPDKTAEKEEMVQWMLVWLENPGVFSTWVRIRKLNRR
jgi:hypothetical protein